MPAVVAVSFVAAMVMVTMARFVVRTFTNVDVFAVAFVVTIVARRHDHNGRAMHDDGRRAMNNHRRRRREMAMAAADGNFK